MMRAIVEQQVIIAKIKLELSSKFFFLNFKINKLASLFIPYCCFFVSLCLSICIIVSSLCKKKYTRIFHCFFTTLLRLFLFHYPSILAIFLDVNKKKFLLCTSLASMLFLFHPELNYCFFIELVLCILKQTKKTLFFVFCCS